MREPTEEMMDAVRGVLQAIRLHPGVTYKQVLQHCNYRGDDLTKWPNIKEFPDQYVTEQGAAWLIYSIMRALEPPAKPADSVLAWVDGEIEVADYHRNVVNSNFIREWTERWKTLIEVRDRLKQQGADVGRDGWMPIASVPKDGRWIIVSWSSSNIYAVHVARWQDQPRAGWKDLSGNFTEHDPALWLMCVPALPGAAIAADPTK